MNPNYIGMKVHPWIKEAGAEYDYEKRRVDYCRLIIKQKPNTPAARNAQLLIDDIKSQFGIE